MTTKSNKKAAKPAQGKKTTTKVVKNVVTKKTKMAIKPKNIVATENEVQNLNDQTDIIDAINDLPTSTEPVVEEMLVDTLTEEEQIIEPIVEEISSDTATEEVKVIEPIVEPMVVVTEEVVETKEEKIIKPKRKDLKFEKLVGCSYHMHRKFLKKLFKQNEIVLKFVKGDLGYNGHLEVLEDHKSKALTILETFKTENPTIKNLCWGLD